MANEKISQLPTVTNADVGVSSIIPIVDSIDSATKSIALSQLDERWTVDPLTNEGDLIYGGASGTPTRLPGNTTTTQEVLTQTGTGSLSAAPVWQALPGNSSALKTPTIQKFLSTGTTTGYVFIVTSANATAGATYTNNGHTYTVLYTISGETLLYTSQASAPQSSGTLTKASGTGDSTITFSSAIPLANYTRPSNPAPLYIKVRMVGGGGGGGPSGSSIGAPGTAGGLSTFEKAYAFGGSGGQAGPNSSNSGGAASLNGGAAIGIAFQGMGGGSGMTTASSIGAFMMGGSGGSTPFGGAGVSFDSGGSAGAGTSAVANTGSGGGGGCSPNSSSPAYGGQGGGAGGYVEATLPAGNYFYSIGVGGTAGTAGIAGGSGGSGAAGIIIIEEYYQ